MPTESETVAIGYVLQRLKKPMQPEPVKQVLKIWVERTSVSWGPPSGLPGLHVTSGLDMIFWFPRPRQQLFEPKAGISASATGLTAKLRL